MKNLSHRYTGDCHGLRRGFSLIELLVSIAVIAILTTITAAGIGNMRKSAMRAQNVGNLKALMSAWNLYAADNEGFFPVGLSWSGVITNPPSLSTFPGYRYWWRYYGGAASYLPTLTPRDTEAFNNYNGPRAPTWQNMYSGYFSPLHIDEARRAKTTWVGYHFNRYVGMDRRTSLNEMSDPARTPVLFAYWNSDRASSGLDPADQYFSSAYKADPNSAGFLRWGTDTMGGGNHFAFADGHIEWIPKMDTLDEYNKNMQWRLAER